MSKAAEATALLDEATKDCGTAKKVADGQSDYSTAILKAQRAYSALDKLPPDQKKPFAKDLETIKSKIAQAMAKADKEKKPAEAMPILAEAEKLLASVKTQADMQAGLNEPVPNVAYIKQLMNEAGGTKALDKMVLAMDDKTSGNVLKAALEARFNFNFEQKLTDSKTRPDYGTSDKTAPDKSVKRIYELLLKVPESHVAQNSKFTSRTIKRYQEDSGGGVYYYGGTTAITLNSGRAGAKGSSNQGAQLGDPSAFPDGVDPDCQPNDETKNRDIRYFDWVTLHEVGHGVDDKKGVMKDKQKEPAFGAWEVYGNDVTKTAEAAQKKFKYDLAYIKSKLLGTNPAPVAVPAGTDAKQWAAAQTAVDKFCTTVLSYGVWWSGSLTKEVTIEGRVYQHMGDPNQLPPRLVSYDYSARKRGIHGYQFRAPAEWFAELYAAYYMGVLKPEHPSIKAIKAYLPDSLG